MREPDRARARSVGMEVARGPRDWENPGVYSRNKCRAHVPLRAHPSPDAALRYFVKGPSVTESPYRVSLNGKNWSFHLFDRPESVPKAFWDPAFDDARWGKVGSSWPLLAHDWPHAIYQC